VHLRALGGVERGGAGLDLLDAAQQILAAGTVARRPSIAPILFAKASLRRLPEGSSGFASLKASHSFCTASLRACRRWRRKAGR
jgi:hypothetical protein